MNRFWDWLDGNEGWMALYLFIIAAALGNIVSFVVSIFK